LNRQVSSSKLSMKNTHKPISLEDRVNQLSSYKLLAETSDTYTQYLRHNENSIAHDIKNILNSFNLQAATAKMIGLIPENLNVLIHGNTLEFVSMFEEYRKIVDYDFKGEYRLKANKELMKFLQKNICPLVEQYQSHFSSKNIDSLPSKDDQELAKELKTTIKSIKDELKQKFNLFENSTKDLGRNSPKKTKLNLLDLIKNNMAKVDFTEGVPDKPRVGIWNGDFDSQNNIFYITADQQSISSVLENLFRNALQHAKYYEGKFVGADIQKVGDEIIFVQYNNGPAMSEELKDIAFTTGVRDPKKPGSSGFGLPHVKWCCELNNVHVDVLKAGEQVPITLNGIEQLDPSLKQNFLDDNGNVDSSRLNVFVLRFASSS
jgi:signal transduction histidine kinase